MDIGDGLGIDLGGCSSSTGGRSGVDDGSVAGGLGASDSSGAGGSSGGDSGVIAGDDIGDIIFGAGGNGVNDDGVDGDSGESYCENGKAAAGKKTEG